MESSGGAGGRGEPGQGAGAPAVIICAADSAYALPLAVMLESLSAHADPDRKIDVYIIDNGLSAAERARIDAQARPNLLFYWRESIRSAEIGDPHWGHVSGATYDRLLIDRYLPGGTGHVLWLDCDLLVLDDITSLFERPLAGKVLRAVRDPLVQSAGSRFGVYGWKEQGLSADDPYFNAGVMLIDMARWRACEVADRSLAHLQRYGKHIFFNEQEALNAVIADDWEPLEDRWNYSANPFHARRQSLAGATPAILHFAGRTKPWKLPDLGEVQDLFFQHLDKTAWRGNRPRRTVRNRVWSWYIHSPFRHLTYPLENWYLRLSHRLEL